MKRSFGCPHEKLRQAEARGTATAMWGAQEDDPGGAAIDGTTRQILAVVEIFGRSDECLHDRLSISIVIKQDGKTWDGLTDLITRPPRLWPTNMMGRFFCRDHRCSFSTGQPMNHFLVPSQAIRSPKRFSAWLKMLSWLARSPSRATVES